MVKFPKLHHVGALFSQALERQALIVEKSCLWCKNGTKTVQFFGVAVFTVHVSILMDGGFWHDLAAFSPLIRAFPEAPFDERRVRSPGLQTGLKLDQTRPFFSRSTTNGTFWHPLTPCFARALDFNRESTPMDANDMQRTKGKRQDWRTPVRRGRDRSCAEQAVYVKHQITR